METISHSKPKPLPTTKTRVQVIYTLECIGDDFYVCVRMKALRKRHNNKRLQIELFFRPCGIITNYLCILKIKLHYGNGT